MLSLRQDFSSDIEKLALREAAAHARGHIWETNPQRTFYYTYIVLYKLGAKILSKPDGSKKKNKENKKPAKENTIPTS